MTSLDSMPSSGNMSALINVAEQESTLRIQGSTLKFDIEWITHFNERLNRLPPNEPQILVVSANQPQLAIKFSSVGHKVPMIRGDRTNRPGIIIVGNAAGSRGLWIPADGKDLQQLVSWAESNDIVGTFTLAGIAGSMKTTVFPGGLDQDDLSYSIDHSIGNQLLTAEDISADLDRFRDTVLNAADLNKKIWKEGTEWIPVATTEKSIQDQLMIFFRGKFVSTKDLVLQEISNPDGRCDLLVKSKQINPNIPNTSLVREFVLELKALKSFTETKNDVPTAQHEAAMAKGIQQALEYRETLQVEVVFLCVFDLRKTITGDLKSRVADACLKDEIVPWWERIFPSTAERRKDEMEIA